MVTKDEIKNVIDEEIVGYLLARGPNIRDDALTLAIDQKMGYFHQNFHENRIGTMQALLNISMGSDKAAAAIAMQVMEIIIYFCHNTKQEIPLEEELLILARGVKKETDHYIKMSKALVMLAVYYDEAFDKQEDKEGRAITRVNILRLIASGWR
jgi:hypothetical protein